MFTQDDNQSQNTNNSVSSDQAQDVVQPTVDEIKPDEITSATTQDPIDVTQMDQPAQDVRGDQAGYVDSYSPPPQASTGEDKINQDKPPTQATSASAEDALKELEELMKQAQAKQAKKPIDQAPPVAPKADDSASTASPVSPSDMSDAPKMTMPPSTQAQANQVASQELADQNIFFLLGAEDGSLEEQEQFLDELQQTVWDDFVANDMPLLITSEEKVKADEILNNSELEELDKQEQLLDYLDGLVPDLEEIMLEKALRLKEDLVRERVASYKESFTQDQVKLQQLQEVENLMKQNQWQTVGEKLNQME